MLDRMEKTGLTLETHDRNLRIIAKTIFGLENVKMTRRTTNHLIVTYDYRESPVYDYLSELLKAHPTCWMKNKYYTNDGLAGIWLGRMKDGKVWEQQHDWEELYTHEIDEEDYDYSL